jgi:hypothetical protein
LLVYIHIV